MGRHCVPCEGIGKAFDESTVTQHQKEMAPQWTVNKNPEQLSRTFKFKNYYQTMAFVNAIAWVAHTENHHPDLTVKYNECMVCYTTHALNGLSLNDFICAKKVDALFTSFEETQHVTR